MSDNIVLLDNYVDILSGYALKSKAFGDSGTTPVIRIRDVVRGYSETYTTQDFPEKYTINNGELLIGMDGEFNAAVWKGGKAVLNQRVCRITPKEGLDFNYLKHFLPKALKEIEDRTAFVTVKHLSVKKIKAIKIPLPPLEEQKRIASILDKADNLRRLYAQRRERTEELLRSTFLDMFGDPVTNPKDWEVKNFESFASLLSGFAFKSKEYSSNPSDTKLCRGINVGLGNLSWKDTAYWAKSSSLDLEKYVLSEWDIVVAMDRPWISGGFKSCLLTKKDENCLLVQRVMRIRALDKIYAPFIHQLINHPFFKRSCHITETTIPHISPNDFKRLKVIAPPLHRVKEYFDLYQIVTSVLDNQSMHMDSSNNLFNSLLQRAFKGELKSSISDSLGQNDFSEMVG